MWFGLTVNRISEERRERESTYGSAEVLHAQRGQVEHVHEPDEPGSAGVRSNSNHTSLVARVGVVLVGVIVVDGCGDDLVPGEQVDGVLDRLVFAVKTTKPPVHTKCWCKRVGYWGR